MTFETSQNYSKLFRPLLASSELSQTALYGANRFFIGSDAPPSAAGERGPSDAPSYAAVTLPIDAAGERGPSAVRERMSEMLSMFACLSRML